MPLFGLLFGGAVARLLNEVDQALEHLASENNDTPSHSQAECEQDHGGPSQRKSLPQQQLDGDIDSSEVANITHLGATGTYSNVKRDDREFSKGKDGDKGLVEADHIPPLDSVRRAAEEPLFWFLRFRNPRLYDLVISLRDDPRGENLLTVQVLKHHHRDALSTGSSRVSREARLLLARSIARGDVSSMLKLAFIIAHPYAAQQIRDDAGIGNRPQEMALIISEDRTMRIYTAAFHKLLVQYRDLGIMNQRQFRHLTEYVDNCGYLERGSSEYEEILKIVRDYGKPQK
ncbi:uncharacterized protein LOC115354695 isoform X2 [Myripristis murdjan]|uniref:uncharacterized protein LOC115354695 isoform X2 n=1 Tax=Myripristis murdjan TaxID=586833 RepID=UPI00117641CD|nr:uncharacterized protein LOC115354695 isoform X2 [Myripristis murdjan]